MEKSSLTLRVSPRLKGAFMAVCADREISLSDAIRDFMAKEVRNFQRKTTK
jgi:antitoxin component of RelBE/YafQ-DinJ toxin-antitoxin module